MRRRPALALALALALPAAGCGGGGGAPGKRTVTVVMRHSRYVPERIEVAAGTTVRFVVRNLDPIDHELIVGDAATHRRHERGTERSHDLPGEVSVPAGAEAATTYTFERPGRVAFGCHLPGHWDYGMRGLVVVT